MTGRPLPLAVGSVLILTTYALLDRLLRQEKLLKLPAHVLLVLGSALVGLAPVWPWPGVLPVGFDAFAPLGLALTPAFSGAPVTSGGLLRLASFDGLRALATLLAVITAWNATTRDHDIVAGGPGGGERLLTFAGALGSWASPGPFLVTVALLSLRFHFWQHHATFPMRVLLMSAAAVLSWEAWVAIPGIVAPTLGLADLTAFGRDMADALPAALVLMLTTLVVSHYFITALAKMVLGPRPWSWFLHNRLHHLAASAYSWGWGRFLPWNTFRRFVRLLRRVELPLQLVIFSLELTIVLAFLDARLSAFYCLAFAGFHLGVFLVAGLLFWDWIATDVILALLFLGLSPQLRAVAFGLPAEALGVLLLALFPLRHKLWRPMPLGWYDSPLTQRICYVVRGESGKAYGLYNNFMCPHERLYGKVQGCFAYAGKVLTYHLGEVFKLDLRDAIVAAGPSASRLEEVKEQYGIEPWSTELTLGHMCYLKAYFARLNSGARKSALPGMLRMLKAPGDQLFYWGELPPFRGQERALAVELIYREEYFDGDELRRLADETILIVPVSEASAEESFATERTSRATVAPPRELTPKQLDDYLLGLARGRLIDLPEFKKTYLGGDDGAPLPREKGRPRAGKTLKLSPARKHERRGLCLDTARRL